MGVDESTKKKLLIERHPLFKEAISYLPDERKFLSHIANNEDHRVILFDSIIWFEETIEKATKLKRELNQPLEGSFFFSLFIKHISPYINAKGIDAIIICMDKGDGRPPTKDIDTKRLYDLKAKPFIEVTDRKFPLASHPNESELKALNKENNKLQRHMVTLEKKLKVYEKKMKTIKYKHPTKATLQAKAKILQELQEVSTKYKVTSSKLKEKADILKNDKEYDVWKWGKGNIQNRKMVYRYLTQKFIEYLERYLIDPSQVIILDSAVLNGKDYCQLQIKLLRTPSKYSRLELYTGKEHSELGEGEQSIMYYLHTYSKMGIKRFIIKTKDTDILTYLGINWTYFGDIDVFLVCKNYYASSDKEEFRDIRNQKVYIIRFNDLAQKMRTYYKNLTLEQDPLSTFFSIWGVFLGCDFIKDVHKTVHQVKTDEAIDDFLQYFFFYILQFKTDSNTEFIVKTSVVESKLFQDNKYYNTQINAKQLIKLLRFYRDQKIEKQKLRENNNRKKKLKPFVQEELDHLNVILKNTSYVLNYMKNQFRIISPDLRKVQYPPCDTKLHDTYIFGYKRDPITGRIIQDY